MRVRAAVRTTSKSCFPSSFLETYLSLIVRSSGTNPSTDFRVKENPRKEMMGDAGSYFLFFRNKKS